MQLSAAQLAAAQEVLSDKAVTEFVCFDTSVALGGLLTLVMSRVCTSEGASLEGKDRIGLYTLLLPLVTGLGHVDAATMEEHLRGAERQENGASGAAAAKKLVVS